MIMSSRKIAMDTHRNEKTDTLNMDTIRDTEEDTRMDIRADTKVDARTVKSIQTLICVVLFVSVLFVNVSSASANREYIIQIASKINCFVGEGDL